MLGSKPQKQIPRLHSAILNGSRTFSSAPSPGRGSARDERARGTATPHVKFTLRSYTPADFEAIYEIDQECFERDIAYTRRDMRAYLQFPGAECVLAQTVRGKLAGFCIGARRGPLGYLITMDVLRQYRRKGAAAGLLAELERRLASRGTTEVWLETATDNEAAIAFWLKHGYRKRGVREGYYPDGTDAFTMQKVLTKNMGDSPDQ